MKLIRYQDSDGIAHYGKLEPDGSTTRIDGDVFGDYTISSDVADVRRQMAPVTPPSILGIGLNYRRHAKESGMELPNYPVVFMKAPSAVQAPGEPILLPTHLKSASVDYECELAVVIGKRCKNADRTTAFDHVLGLTCANDVSARDWQIARGGSQWCRGKTFDTFAPLGPCIATLDEFSDANDLSIRTILNGDVVQDSRTSDMLFDIASLIEFLSGSTTLLPGTVILTGTPHGVGMASNPPRFLRDGDVVTIEIEGIGALTNPVRYEP